MHPIEPAIAPPPMPVDRLQPESWFHQYSNAYPRMDDQQYGGRTPDDLAPPPEAGAGAQAQPRRAQP